MSNTKEKAPVRQPRRALVLGCGGVAGGAWSIAALAALQQTLDWDPRNADIIVGTSAGAVLATLLGAGVSIQQMLASQRGDASAQCAWDHDRDTGGALPPMPQLRANGAALIWRGITGSVSPLTALCALAPRGRFDMTPFRRLIDSVVPSGQWVPHPAVWIMAVDLQTGGRVAFGRDDAPQAAINDAVCASYGVPAWCPPVAIQGRNYFDGGTASPTSADYVADTDVDEVFILAPMSSRRVDRPRSPLARIERRARRMMTAIVDREEALLKSRGKRVYRIEPGPDDLQAFGFNMMDPARRRDVFATALQTTPMSVGQAVDAVSTA